MQDEICVKLGLLLCWHALSTQTVDYNLPAIAQNALMVQLADIRFSSCARGTCTTGWATRPVDTAEHMEGVLQGRPSLVQIK